MNENNQLPLERLTSDLGSVIIWVLLGLALMWFVGFAGQQTLRAIQPVLMFLIIAAIVGVAVAHLLGL